MGTHLISTHTTWTFLEMHSHLSGINTQKPKWTGRDGTWCRCCVQHVEKEKRRRKYDWFMTTELLDKHFQPHFKNLTHEEESQSTASAVWHTSSVCDGLASVMKHRRQWSRSHVATTAVTKQGLEAAHWLPKRSSAPLRICWIQMFLPKLVS